MTIWYVGPGGSDANSGRTWGTRLATLNGAEDQPVVAGDFVWVGPGVYREMLTVDVSGGAGTEIIYCADVTGEHTDGVGGIVRITGSDNDQTAVRANCIVASDKDYRIFRGFSFDTSSSSLINTTNGCRYWTIEDCIFQNPLQHISIQGADQLGWIIRRCLHSFCEEPAIYFVNAGDVDNAVHVIENCLFTGLSGGGLAGVRIIRIGGITIRNISFIGCNNGVRSSVALGGAATAIAVNNCIFVANAVALNAIVLGDIVENFNTFYANSTDRTNVAVGANSQTYPPLLQPPILFSGADQISGFRLPWWFGSLSEWSQVRQITGSNEPDEDLFGVRRPYTHGGPVPAFCSWGAIQWQDFERSDIRSYDGSLSNLVREKSAAWMFVPGVSAVSTTISVRAYRTAGYGGQRGPTMLIKQPGQPDRMTIDAGGAGAWNLLTDTFTPAADPPWLVVEMRNECDFTTTTTTSTLSTTTTSTVSTTTVTVTTLTTTTTTLACDVWFDALRVS